MAGGGGGGVAALVLAEGPGPERQCNRPGPPSIMAPFHSSPAGESVARRVVGDRTGRPRCVSLATRPPSPADLRLRLVWRGGNEQNDPFVCLARLYLVTFKHLVLPAITSNRTSLATFFTPTPVHPLTPQAPSSAFPRFPLSTGLAVVHVSMAAPRPACHVAPPPCFSMLRLLARAGRRPAARCGLGSLWAACAVSC